MLRNFFILAILFPLISCGGGWDDFESAISGKKKATTDEYLIKKKDPIFCKSCENISFYHTKVRSRKPVIYGT